MRRIRLFGRGGATKVGQGVYDDLRKAVKPILARAERAGYDLHDFELMTCRVVELDCALARIKRYVKRRRVPRRRASGVSE